MNEESKIELYRDDEKIGQLNDDGQNGDRKANDGCYSVEITISPTDEIEFYSFNVILGECTSNEVKVYVYDEITDEDCDVSAEVLNLLTEIENKYKNGQGYVDYENYSTVIEEMSSCVENYSAENNVSIIAMEKDTNGLFITFSSGIQVMYILSQPDVEELGSEVYLKVRTLEPYFSSSNSNLPSFSEQAELIDDTLDEGAEYDLFYNDLDVTHDNIISCFQPGCYIVWHGHGGYFDSAGSVVATGIESTNENIKLYANDIQAGRMIATAERLVINYKYFDEYVNDLSGGFVYLGGCHTGQDSNLMDVMLWKDAEVSLGFSETVFALYDSACIDTLVGKMCTYDDETNSYMYFEKAFNETIDTCGESDFQYFAKIGKSYGEDAVEAYMIYSANSNLSYHIDQGNPEKQRDDDSGDNPGIGDKIDDYVDDKISDAEDKLLDRLEKWLNDILLDACSGC